MGFLKNLFALGAAAGTAVAAVKVAEKYKQNKEAAEKLDLNEDGKTDLTDTLIGVSQAAKDVYNETAEVVKEKAPAVIVKVKAKTAEVVEKVREVAAETAEEVEPIVIDLKEDAEEFIADASAEIRDFVEEIKEE